MNEQQETPVMELEEPQTREALPQEAHFDEAAAAHKAFKDNMALFNEGLDVFPGSSRQLKRAWANAALAPLNEGPLQWSYEAEKELFDIYTELNSAKFILMVHGLADAGVLTLHKPLMEATASTPSEVALKQKMSELTDGEVINLGPREAPTEETTVL